MMLWLATSAVPAAHAAVFVVDDLGTSSDANAGDGVCADAMGHCTWRAAAQETNALPGADVIGLPAGTYAGESVSFTDDVEVIGAGAAATVLDGEDARTILFVDGPVVTVRGVHFTRGSSGGAGAIDNFGTLTVRDCAFTANATTNSGGAISSGTAITIERSTFTGNTAAIGGGAIFIGGGTATIRETTLDANESTANASGIHAQVGSTLTVENTTIANGVDGPGIVLASGTAATLRHVTVTGHAETGLVVYSPSSAMVANTVIAGNALDAAFTDQCLITGSFTSLGGNLASDATCAFDAPTDLENTDAMLGTLADNGGPTMTIAPLGGSPVVDGALGAECLATDQRGVSRPVGPECDRGAVESGGAVPTTTTTTFPTTTTTSSSTSTTVTSSTSTTVTSSTSTSTSQSSTTSTVTTTTTFSTSTSSISTSTTTTSSATSSSSTTTSTSQTTTTSIVTTTTVPVSTSSTTTTTSTTSTTSTLGSTSTSTSTSTVPTSSTTSTTVGASTTTSTSVTTSTLPLALFPTARKLLVKAARSGAQALRVVVKDAAVAIPAECAVDGAVAIQVGGGAVTETPLEAALWRPLKAKKPELGCKYGRGAVVATAKVRAGKGFKIVAKGDDLGVPLATDPRPVRIELRHGTVRHCLEFGGAMGKHVPDKKLIAKRAEATSRCPGE